MNSLKNLKNQFAAVLTRDEMKNVVGGETEWGYNFCRCNNDVNCTIWYPPGATVICTELCKLFDENCEIILELLPPQPPQP